MKKLFWKILGGLALALGLIGVVLPVVPTTPFIILGAFAFARGSPKMARMLENHRIFGPIIVEWRQHGAIAPKFKALAIGMMAVAFGGSVIANLAPVILLVQAVCMSGAAIFILSRPSGTE